MYILHDFLERCGCIVPHYFLYGLSVFMLGVSFAGHEVGFDDP